MLIALHLGAHKTATTYIQNALELSREKLDEFAVAYIPLIELRSTLTERLGIGRSGLKAAAGQLLSHHRSHRRLIISDENIIGGLKPSFAWGFYPRRRMRLLKLLRKLGQHDLRIYFATRSYDEFISAMYCEYIRHHPFVDTYSYLRGTNYETFSWLDVIETFVSLIGAENVTIWRHEDFPAVERQVFAALIGGQPDMVDKPSGRIRESLSKKAVQSLASLPPTSDADELRARARSAAAAHPKGAGNPPFSAFDHATAEALRARYEHEISHLREVFPEIHVLARHGNPVEA